MLTKLLALIWITLGSLWLMKPEWMRGWLKRKITRKMRWTFFGIALVVGFYLIGIAFRLEGTLPKIAGLFGVIAVIKAILLVSSKSLDKTAVWVSGLPLSVLRLWSFGTLICGILLWKV